MLMSFDRFYFCRLVLFIMTWMAMLQSGPAQMTTPALQRAYEIIELINSGDRKAAAAYIKKNYAPQFLEIPLNQHLDFISEFHDNTRGVSWIVLNSRLLLKRRYC